MNNIISCNNSLFRDKYYSSQLKIKFLYTVMAEFILSMTMFKCWVSSLWNRVHSNWERAKFQCTGFERGGGHKYSLCLQWVGQKSSAHDFQIWFPSPSLPTCTVNNGCSLINHFLKMKKKMFSRTNLIFSHEIKKELHGKFSRFKSSTFNIGVNYPARVLRHVAVWGPCTRGPMSQYPNFKK